MPSGIQEVFPCECMKYADHITPAAIEGHRMNIELAEAREEAEKRAATKRA